MNIQEDKYFKLFLRSRNLRQSTQNLYKQTLKRYCEFTRKTPTQLINEAEKEEKERLRMRERQIKLDLLDYTEYMNSQNFSPLYIKKTMTEIRTFYREFEIELPKTVPIRNDEQILITTDNMMNKDHIKKALGFANLKYKAIILLMSSSGMGAAEVTHLTIGDFLKSLEIGGKELISIGELDTLLTKKSEYELIPTWKIKRYKTRMPYFTFSSPESTRAILNYLHQREYQNTYPQSREELLFMNYDRGEFHVIKNNILGTEFRRLNIKCGFGKQGRLSFFRSHNLRKFFATTLQKNGLQQIITDWLLGHKLNPVTGAYFKPDILAVKKEYMKALPDLSLENTEIKDIHSREYEDILDRLKSVEEELQLHKELKGLDKSK